LEDTVEFFNIVLQLKLAPHEKQDLVAFMRTMTMTASVRSVHLSASDIGLLLSYGAGVPKKERSSLKATAVHLHKKTQVPIRRPDGWTRCQRSTAPQTLIADLVRYSAPPHRSHWGCSVFGRSASRQCPCVAGWIQLWLCPQLRTHSAES
jgi:hypothetical protein